MLKYFLGFVLLLAISVFITSQYQQYTHHPAAPSKNSGSAAITSTNPQKSTTDAEDAERDHPRWYLAYLVFGWPNGITVWALFFTLMALAEQTGATRKAAEASLKQVVIQRESLRPRLTIGFSSNPYNDIVAGKFVTLIPEFINSGGIPAYEVIAETWIEWLTDPFEFTLNAVHHKGKPLSVHPNKPLHYRVPFKRRLTPVEIFDFRSASATICIRIRLEYTVFGESVHTEEAYAVEPGGMSGISKYSHSN